MSEIVKLAKGGNYQLACQKHFDVVHPNWKSFNIRGADTAANHPNQWFQASADFHKALNGPAPAKANDSTIDSRNEPESSVSPPDEIEN